MNVVTINISTDFIEVTKAELDALIASSSLIKSKFYRITDRDIFLQALKTNVISSTGTRTMRIVKNLYYTPDSGSGILGVWNTNVTPTIGDVTVWGGKVWENTTGNVGTFTDNTALDPTDWELIPTTNETYYFTKSFGCTYDIENDWVASQWDDRGNVFTSSWILGVNFGYTISPNDFSDWGNEQIFGNTCFGISNNSNVNFIILNSNSGGIFNNSNSGEISNNSNSGEIYNNSNSGIISNNSNLGGIYNNSNLGGISTNSNSGVIYYNSNAGIIDSITSDTTNIEYNTNNGDIVTTTTGDISDAVVNK